MGQKTCLHVDLLIWTRSVHCTKAEPNPGSFGLVGRGWVGGGGVGVGGRRSCSHHFHHLFLNPLPFEDETLNGVVRERQRQGAGTLMLAAVFVPWLAATRLDGQSPP